MWSLLAARDNVDCMFVFNYQPQKDFVSATEQALGITPQLMTVPLHFSIGVVLCKDLLYIVQRFAPEIWLLASLLAISGLFGAGGAEWRRSSAMQQLTLCWMTLIIFLRFARAWFGNYSWLVVVGSMILCFTLFERYSPLKVKENYQKSQEVCAPCWVKVWPHINMDAVLHQRCPKGQEEKGSWCSPPRTLWDGTNSPSGVDSKKSI